MFMTFHINFCAVSFVLGDVAETENLDQSQLDQSLVTEIAKQQVIVQYLKVCITMSVPIICSGFGLSSTLKLT